MAHAERRGKGRWRARYRTPDGAERSQTFSTKAAADRWLATMEVAKSKGVWVDPALGRQTFESYSEEWLEGQGHLAPLTARKVAGHVANHLVPEFGTMRLASIQPSTVRRWVADLSERRSPATVQGVHSTLSRIMRTAVRDGIIGRSPCEDVDLPRGGPTEEMRFLEPAQVARLAEAIDDRYRALIFLAAYGGLRWREIAALQVDSLDLLRGTVVVRASLADVGGELITQTPKSGKARSVALPRFLSEMLGVHVGAYSAGGYVFTSAEGLPLRRSNWYRRHFQPAAARADIGERLRFHDLRHTAAALAIAQGAHPKAIQERLGHSTIRLTFDRYGHLFPGLDETLREGLDAAYLGTPAASPRPERGQVVALDASQAPRKGA